MDVDHSQISGPWPDWSLWIRHCLSVGPTLAISTAPTKAKLRGT